LSKDQAIKELQEVVDYQKTIYVNAMKRILRAKGTIARKIRIIKNIKIKFYKNFTTILNNYLNVVCLFGLRQTTKELGIKNPKKLSSDINSWIKAIVYTIVIKYFNEINLLVTLPIINNIGRGLSDNELIYRLNIIFDKVRSSKPNNIVNGIEGKALFRGRDLAVKIFNGNIRLEVEGFSAASISDILKREKVVAAQWSAILDKNVCELCASLDGRIIDIESPSYAYYSPGDLHLGCRCMWVYITSAERPENRVIDWKKPSTALLKKYGNSEISGGSRELLPEEQ